MNAGFLRLTALGCFAFAGACADGDPRGAGRGVEISVAPLTLPGADDVCYGIYIQNQSGDVVVALNNICSSQYGNGPGGDISYVAPCDASSGDDVNTVTLVLEGIDVAPGVTVSKEDEDEYVNPCGWDTAQLPSSTPPTTPSETTSPLAPNNDATVNDDGFRCVRTFTCKENEDVSVPFNLTVMRDADQGFFDIAVNFEDVFCSAKIDSCYDVVNADFIDLLFDDQGNRVPTAVMAAACSAGTDDANTTMWMSEVAVSCTGPSGTVSFTIDPTGNNSNDSTSDGLPGNHCVDVEIGAGTGPVGAHATGTVTFAAGELQGAGDSLVQGTRCHTREGLFLVTYGPDFTLDTSATNTESALTLNITAVAEVSVDPAIDFTGDVECILADGTTTFILASSTVTLSGGSAPVAGAPIKTEVCYALYWGQENLVCQPGNVPCNKEYWNLAINLDDLDDANLADCSIGAAVTASSTTDVSPPKFVNGQLPGPGQTYGYIEFDADLTGAAGVPLCFQGPMGSAKADVLYGTTLDMSPSNAFPQLCYSFTQGTTAPVAHAYPDCGDAPTCVPDPNATVICHGGFWPVCFEGVTYTNDCFLAAACGSVDGATAGACTP